MNFKQRLEKIREFPNHEVSSDGRVFNKDGVEMKQQINRHGYSMVNLSYNGHKRNISVHRLVAEAFIPNPDGKRTVNHIDCDKQNNDVSNLEWCSHGENQKHAYDHGLRCSYLTQEDRLNGARIHKENSRRSVLVEETGAVYPGLSECASALGCDKGAISKCCNGLANQHHGLHFRFVDEEDIEYEF